MVDIAVAGHLDASAAALIGGISVGSLMFDLMYWNFGFLRAGTGGLTAQAYGREDWAGCSAILRRGLGTALLAALLLLLVQWPFQKLIFLFVRSSEEVKTLALRYFHIRVWAAPATLCLMVMRGWFIGMQDSFSSMLTDVIVNVSNIIISVILALGIPGTSFRGIGFIGIAWGTVIAQYSGLLAAATISLLKYKEVILPGGYSSSGEATGLAFAKVGREASRRGSQRGSHGEESGGDATGRPFTRTGREASGAQSPVAARATTPPMREFLKVNRDLFVRSLCLMAVYLSFTAISARFGDTLLAMSSIMMKLMLIFSYFTDGFAFAGEALTGRFFGRRDTTAVNQTVKWTFIWSMGIGALFIVIYTAGGIPMFHMMTTDSTVVEAAKEFIPWLAVMPLIGCPAFTWDGIYIGATATREMRDSNLGCVIAFFAVWFIGWALFKPAGGGRVHLLFAAYYAHLIFRSLYQTFKYKPAILERM